MLLLLPARKCKWQREAVGSFIGGLEGRETETKTRTSQLVRQLGKWRGQTLKDKKKSITLNSRFSFTCRTRWEEGKRGRIYES